MASKTYKAKVLTVVSGDDFVLLVDLNVDGLHKEVRARLRGVDAPNAYKEEVDSEAGRLRDEVRALVTNTTVTVDVYHEGRGGWIVDMRYLDSETGTMQSLGEILQRRGYKFTAPRS